VRVTISHNRSKEDVIQSVDRSFDQIFQAGALPVRLTITQRNWQGSTLNFSLTAKMGLVSTPIQGTVAVTDSDLTIDVDLGILGRLIPTETVRDAIGSRVKGLLK
jgi:hypothetical protein